MARYDALQRIADSSAMVWYPVPVSIHVLAITAMVVSAFLARIPNRRVEAGALLFLISDSVLAINRFRVPCRSMVGSCGRHIMPANF